jgi:hypothetical protein
MHEQPKAVDNATQDLQDERTVLLHVMETFPNILREPDLIRELTESDALNERDRIVRAVRDLVKVGLLIRCDGGAILPTRQTSRAYDLFNA